MCFNYFSITCQRVYVGHVTRLGHTPLLLLKESPFLSCASVEWEIGEPGARRKPVTSRPTSGGVNYQKTVFFYDLFKGNFNITRNVGEHVP